MESDLVPVDGAVVLVATPPDQSRVHDPLKDFTEHGHEGDEPVVAGVALAPRLVDRPCNVFAPGAGRDLVRVDEVKEISEDFEPGVAEVADELPFDSVLSGRFVVGCEFTGSLDFLDFNPRV